MLINLFPRTSQQWWWWSLKDVNKSQRQGFVYSKVDGVVAATLLHNLLNFSCNTQALVQFNLKWQTGSKLSWATPPDSHLTGYRLKATCVLCTLVLRWLKKKNRALVVYFTVWSLFCLLYSFNAAYEALKKFFSFKQLKPLLKLYVMLHWNFELLSKASEQRASTCYFFLFSML